MLVHPDHRKKRWQRSARLELFILNFSYCTYPADGISFVLLKSLNKNVNTSLDDSQALPWAVIWGFLRNCPLSLGKYHCLEWSDILDRGSRSGRTLATFSPHQQTFPFETVYKTEQLPSAATKERLLLIIYFTHTHTQKVPDSIFLISLQIIQPAVHFCA